MTDTPAKSVLEVSGVSVHFGGLLALDNVSFSVSSNQIVGLIGPNGAGKTTAFNVICGFIAPTSGQINFPSLGKSSLRPNQLAHNGIARTLQGVGLFTHQSVIENVMAGAQSRPGSGFWTNLLSLPSSVRSERILRNEAMQMLDRLGIVEFANELPSAIPYGITKKVSVARALMTNPSLLLLDEPASGLDEGELESFAALIQELKSSMSILLVEHNMDFVMPLVEQLVVLSFGQVIASGTPQEIGSNQAVLEAYLGVDE